MRGSTFTFFVPQTYLAASAAPQDIVLTHDADDDKHDWTEASSPAYAQEIEDADRLSFKAQTNDDSANINADDHVVLIVDDDPDFAQVILEVARINGFKGVISLTGIEAVAMAKKFQPSAITLDVGLPDIDGWAVLDRLKHETDTRHIPTTVISGRKGRKRALKLGAVDFLEKPVTAEQLKPVFFKVDKLLKRREMHLLIIEDNDDQRRGMVELLQNDNVICKDLATGTEAISAIRDRHFDCIIVDLSLPDMPGIDLLRILKEEQVNSPVVVYTGADLGRSEETEIKRLADAIIIKNEYSPERLVEETSLYLHQNAQSLPEQHQVMIKNSQLKDIILVGRKVLIVDDDIRNIFALLSALEKYQMVIQYAENGRDAIEILKSHPDIDIILMDIMMPEMDGYETMQAIRRIEDFRAIPIIAITAKAMRGDREKCIQAGASEYLAKPVDIAELLPLIRVYLVNTIDERAASNDKIAQIAA